MNDDVLKGKSKELAGEIKRRWGKMTDDDMAQLEGNTEKLLGILQARFGYSRDEAMREYDEFVNELNVADDSRKHREPGG